LIAELTEENVLANVPNARDAAIKKANELMKDLAALHEPDMISGGKDVVTNMGGPWRQLVYWWSMAQSCTVDRYQNDDNAS
jgi:N-acetylglucosamine kinase-like BadF-type ATPase